MNAMTLFKALSGLDPQEIADAWDGVPDQWLAAPPDEAVQEEIVPRREKPRLRILRRAAELTAAAACIALAVTVSLKFRAVFNRHPLHSAPDQTTAVHLMTTETTDTTAPQTELSATAPSGTAPDRTVTTTADETADRPAQTAENSQLTAPAVTDGGTAPAVSGQTETETVTGSETPPPAAETKLPLLVAMGDGAGQITGQDGQPVSAGGISWSVVRGKTAIDAYLASDSPEVILGTGKKSAETAAAIRSNPAMIRVRWQSDDNRWESYAVTAAKVTDGVLHLNLAVYCADADGDYPSGPWIYETGLLCGASELPDLRDVQITLTEYADTESSGIREWRRYDDSIDPDLYLNITL